MTTDAAKNALHLLGIDPAKWWESMTLRGLLIIAVVRGLEMAGIEIGSEQASALIGDFLTIVGGIAVWWGRVRSVRPIDTETVLPGVKLPQ